MKQREIYNIFALTLVVANYLSKNKLISSLFHSIDSLHTETIYIYIYIWVIRGRSQSIFAEKTKVREKKQKEKQTQKRERTIVDLSLKKD